MIAVDLCQYQPNSSPHPTIALKWTSASDLADKMRAGILIKALSKEFLILNKKLCKDGSLFHHPPFCPLGDLPCEGLTSTAAAAIV